MAKPRIVLHYGFNPFHTEAIRPIAKALAERLRSMGNEVQVVELPRERTPNGIIDDYCQGKTSLGQAIRRLKNAPLKRDVLEQGPEFFKSHFFNLEATHEQVSVRDKPLDNNAHDLRLHLEGEERKLTDNQREKIGDLRERVGNDLEMCEHLDEYINRDTRDFKPPNARKLTDFTLLAEFIHKCVHDKNFLEKLKTASIQAKIFEEPETERDKMLRKRWGHDTP